MKASAKKSGPKSLRREGSRPYEVEKHLRQFSEITSQELATTLGALVGELDYALSTQNAMVRERSTLTAISAAERALSLARNLRYFSVHTQINLVAVDLSQVLLDTVELVEKELELNEIKIAVMAEASTYARVDPGALQQVVLNLLAIARRTLGKDGKITLSLRQNEKTIEIRCADSGEGISEEDLERLYTPYVNGSENPVAADALSFAVCRALVEAHGGDISLQSRRGLGTSVIVTLPYDPKLKKPENFGEERRFRRIRLSLPVELFLSRGQTALQTELTTLSIGGCFARISDPNTQVLPELNDMVSIRIGFFGKEVLDIKRARIASVSWAGIHSGVGIEFLELDPRAKKLLEAIVKSHTA